MKRSAVLLAVLMTMVLLAVSASGQVTARGKLTLLRVHDVGSGFGPPNDFIDVEVVIAIDTAPGKFFGFQLRNDSRLPARQGMLDLLRDAFERNLAVNFDHLPVAGRNNSILFRVWLTPPPPTTVNPGGTIGTVNPGDVSPEPVNPPSSE